MGSGKTSLGRRVARGLGLSFVDCDEEIVRRTGASVNLIFDIEGERGFRKREKDMLRELSERRGTLVATGGGDSYTESDYSSWLQEAGFGAVRKLALEGPADLVVGRLVLAKALHHGFELGVLLAQGPEAVVVGLHSRIGQQRGDAAGLHHVMKRVVERPKVGIDLLGEVAGQKPEPLARLYREVGGHSQAAEHYRRFLELWSRADPSEPEVEEARAFLASL